MFFVSNQKNTMTDSFCLRILDEYVDILNSWVDSTDDRNLTPHPIFFSDIDCKGSYWPDFLTNLSESKQEFHPTYQIRSMYIPRNWQIVLYYTNMTRTFCASESPLLVRDFSKEGFDSKERDCVFTTPSQMNWTTDLRSANKITMVSVVPHTKTPYPTSDWTLDMCMGRISSVLGSRNLLIFKPGSIECDRFMESFCKKNPNRPECVCLQEEDLFRNQFCSPLSSDVYCKKFQELSQFVPVTCYSQKCAESGYKFNRMLNNCDVTFCTQMIKLIGNNISIDNTSSIMYCGNKTSNSSAPSPTDAVSFQSDKPPTPSWTWMLVVIGSVILVVILPIAIVIFNQKVTTSSSIPTSVS